MSRLSNVLLVMIAYCLNKRACNTSADKVSKPVRLRLSLRTSDLRHSPPRQIQSPRPSVRRRIASSSREFPRFSSKSTNLSIRGRLSPVHTRAQQAGPPAKTWRRLFSGGRGSAGSAAPDPMSPAPDAAFRRAASIRASKSRLVWRRSGLPVLEKRQVFRLGLDVVVVARQDRLEPRVPRRSSDWQKALGFHRQFEVRQNPRRNCAFRD